MLPPLQGEVVVARFLQWPPNDLENMSLYSVLYFGDGSQKMLAAMTTWLAMLLCWRHHGSDSLQDGQVQGMIKSFLLISSIVKATDAKGNQLESVINRIVQQNVASKVQPISSFAWSSILKSVAPGDRVRDSTFEEALQAYNNHPMVVSYERSESGMGSIALDGRKRQGVRNWMEKTSPECYEEVLKSTHDLPFGLGPFGEVFSYTNHCFLRSAAGLEGIDSEDLEGPLANEHFVEDLWCQLGTILCLFV